MTSVAHFKHRAIFPLTIHSTGRYLVGADGNPFLVHGDTAWAAVAQLTDAEIDSYVDNRAGKGFTAILIEAPVIEYTADGSANNVDGVAPFTTMSPNWNWALNNTYWTRVDRLVNRCKTNDMLVIINPAYVGYDGASTVDGCYAEIQAASVATLKQYGADLAARYLQGNVMWSMGGDWAGTSGERDKQWNIVYGIRSVRATDLVTAHPESSADDSFAYWSGYNNFNVNWSYTYESDGQYAYAETGTAYGRAGPVPVIFFEGKYEGSTGATLAMLRRQSYGAMLSGACGQVYGNNPVWHFESPQWAESYTGTWESNLDSTGATEQTYVKALFAAYSWWKLEPKTDTSLVSSALSSGTTRVIPALASDGTFAMIYVPSSQTVTVVMSAMSPSSVRVRLYDPTAGTYSTASGSPFANTGTQNIATGGERIIVLDAA